ncbi:chromodomain-containing protein [Skeletonema marinoi]|uniref:Chromodomain-containing protein n=1 Tax=Skeletonema marinoi TaxID=267567 RepID=A0AAD8YEA1_9STRA|nr:chromodomain-containing protein [Skeletonema marinoi]
MKIRKHRREQQMKEKRKNHVNVHVRQDGDFFWEVAAVIGRRIRRNRVEYLIRWKGCSEEDNTWEPAANLCDSANEEESLVVEDATLNWTDADQVIFREVKRINVNDPGAAAIVKEDRINGTPLFLLGTLDGQILHSDGLQKRNQKRRRHQAILTYLLQTFQWKCHNLDLSTEKYELDIPKMIKDIGDEDVPVIKRNYDEVKPIHGTIPAAKFLSECWPSSESEAELQAVRRKAQSFTYTNGNFLFLILLVETLPPKQSASEWYHGRRPPKDPGGLEISIAPISGQKECVLVHRDDSRCLYHLTASLDEIDLQRFPLLSQARVYKTVIKPGEILLMPNGTYHQCRNVTPCLSYSRFHLDTVNLLPFKVDEVVDLVQDRVLAYRVTDVVTGDTRETVETLLALRNFIREVARRDEVNKAVKGPGDKSKEELKPELHDFGVLAADVDVCLHDYRYRESKEIPKLKSRKGKVLTNTLSKGVRKNCVGRDLNKFMIDNKPVVVFNSSLENNYMSLRNADVEKHYPLANKHKVGKALIGKLTIGDMLACRLEQKCVKAEVLEVVPQMKAAYISFEDYPSVYDEYQPFDLLRVPSGDEITHNDIKPGLVVLDFSNTNEYRAVVQSTIDGPMVRVKLIVSQHTLTRLVSPAMILGRYMGRWGSSGKKGSSDDSDGKKAAPGGIVSPSTTSDISDIAVEEES